MEWEYLSKPPSPTSSLLCSDFEYNMSSTIPSYSPTPSSSPTGSQNTSPLKNRCTGQRSKTPSESSSCRSPLLEEFRNHMSSFEDLCEIKGHVLEFSRDQVHINDANIPVSHVSLFGLVFLYTAWFTVHSAADGVG